MPLAPLGLVISAVSAIAIPVIKTILAKPAMVDFKNIGCFFILFYFPVLNRNNSSTFLDDSINPLSTVNKIRIQLITNIHDLLPTLVIPIIEQEGKSYLLV